MQQSDRHLDALWLDVVRADEAAGHAVRAASDVHGTEAECDRRQMAAVAAKAARREALLAYVRAHGCRPVAFIEDAQLVEIALKLEIPRGRGEGRAA